MFLRTGFALILSLPILACSPNPSISLSEDEIWKGIEECNGDKLCSVNTLVAKEFTNQAGRDFGQGVKLRGAKHVGNTLIIGVDIPDEIIKNTAKKREFVSAFEGKMFGAALCKHKRIREVIALGGEIQMIGYAPSGEVLTRGKASSC